METKQGHQGRSAFVNEAGIHQDGIIKNASAWNFMKYKVVLKKSKEGFSVSCPGLPGCWSQGKTEIEALENIQTAIREYLEAVEKLAAGNRVREVEITV